MSAYIRRDRLEAARAALRENGLDGWLLFDLEGRNAVATEMLGLPDGTSRRLFVLIRPEGEPEALYHRIERHSFRDWPGGRIEYVGWKELEDRLGALLAGMGRIAMEVSAGDVVPFVDQVPNGVVSLVEATGVTVTTSADLITRSCARWGEEGRAHHVEAGKKLARTARHAWERALESVEDGGIVDEGALAEWIVRQLERAGLEEVDTIVAGAERTALPHYEVPPRRVEKLVAGDVLLLDLWGRLRDEPRSVFADQTWMGILGPDTPEGFDRAWEAVREARDGTVAFLRERVNAGEVPSGAAADRRARKILLDHGYGEDVILHRTGHGIDRALHGFGPNLDSVETRDERRLLEGVGFSVEPGLYFEGRWGIRSEINVYMGPLGPEVTTPDVQDRPWTAGD